MVLKCQYHPHKKTNAHYPSKRKSYSNQDQPKKNYRKSKSHKYKSQYPHKTQKKDIKCFKCGKIGHIAPNCRKQKINILSDKNYYSEAFEDDASSSDDDSKNNDLISEKEKSLTDKIENCLCQLNMLTADQELLIEMIDQI